MSKIRKNNLNNKKGFTLIEALVVVAIVTILATIVVVAINPARQFSKSRNAQRLADVVKILNAVHLEAVHTDGFVTTQIPLLSSNCEGIATNEICRTDASSCTDLVNLTDLTTDGRYMISIPVDPQATSTENGTGYHIIRNSDNQVTVCAPNAENDVEISVKR